jgi:hypothetical protein
MISHFTLLCPHLATPRESIYVETGVAFAKVVALDTSAEANTILLQASCEDWREA